MKQDKRIKHVVNKARLYYGLDNVVHVVDTPSFIDVLGKKGGDVIKLRFYNSGLVTER